MIEAMHEAVKTALFSKTGTSPDNFTTLVSSQIYDTVGPKNVKTPFVVWSFDGINVNGSFDDKETVEANLVVMLVTDYTKGTEYHLSILDALSALRYYSADIGVGNADRLNFQLRSIGGIRLEDKYMISETTLTATSRRT